jgi:hypothetical protein
MTRLHTFAVLVGLIAMIMAQLGGVELHHFVLGAAVSLKAWPQSMSALR